MIQFSTENSVSIFPNGVEYTIPVNNLSTEMSIELAEIEKKRALFITKINEKKGIIDSIQNFIRLAEKISESEIATKLAELETNTAELNKLNEDVSSVILDFYSIYIKDYAEHKAIIRQIPVEQVWNFINELFYASQGKKKQTLPEKILSEAKSPKPKTKSDYVKRGLKKRK